ncbi:flagellar hook capping FlgD N-terminal domain-containing protein [Clostridium sp. CCUG 7971]|uniref:flagellar hook assembly protein FlgD n=1 Tax=Clostridium sp. CCUG 7971 TaxID=2811414 RepID=UPI001ABBBA63|nr:flagellar hook capping FlgD N-terminal domain-containing protein [Clostridium sp. CCUG 7971]MBO3445073.1 flagellar biosynthesis protein FlgD [Clostridium sp. CCUG 7971]
MNNVIAQGKEITPIKSKSYDKTEKGTPIVMPGQEMNKNMFFKLLSAQMSNPDPMNQQDPTQYVTQLAQFTMLEEMMSFNQGMEYLIGMQNGLLANSALSTASSLIDKNVEVYAPVEDGTESESTPKTYTGDVKGVHIKDGVVYLDIKLDETGETKSFEYGSLKKINENVEKKGE